MKCVCGKAYNKFQYPLDLINDQTPTHNNTIHMRDLKFGGLHSLGALEKAFNSRIIYQATGKAGHVLQSMEIRNKYEQIKGDVF